jgi:pimeloyl-ACP methyl ester carboxylesterase
LQIAVVEKEARMPYPIENLEKFWTLMGMIRDVYLRRSQEAAERFLRTIEAAMQENARFTSGDIRSPWEAWSSYLTDFTQRSILFWDTLRERGNRWLENERAGKPPVLVFDFETIVDGRKLPRPCNYALVKVLPPKGMKLDETKRPFLIVDPRAGQGPGIGGFKRESEIGEAFKAGHPVYAVTFFPEPVPGQTIIDVTKAEAEFVRAIAQRHPGSPKPVIIGNCQGGWAVMMLAASQPDITGPIVINGAPLSYWGGNDGKNPMRYSGGLLGGSWLALLASDRGNGKFDGAYLVENFEYLNPANTLWNKYYHVFANIDTEPQRFLDFERWWGEFYLMNEEEILWIVDNLFLGNKLARGEVEAAPGTFLNLKSIRSPIIVFASKGDNITPPQQAFNWISDVYGSTEEIVANGQVIVTLLHESIGHLGIFVSGKVAKKEHVEIVDVLEHIEWLEPGLYRMDIVESQNPSDDPRYEVTLERQGLEDLGALNRYQRVDEKPFEAVKEVSDLNEKAYSLLVRPFVRAMVTESTAALSRNFHPLRLQRWALSDLNPFMEPIASLAALAKKKRAPSPESNLFRKAEKAFSETLGAALDLYRDTRDATAEALFFEIYGSMLALGVVEAEKPGTRDMMSPSVKWALELIDKGGYPEAWARVRALLGKEMRTIPLSTLAAEGELAESDAILSKLPENALRRIAAEQELIVDLAPDQALQSLPNLLSKKADRQQVLTLLDKIPSLTPLNPVQRATVASIRSTLSAA